MNLTDQEKFRQILERSGSKDVCFPQLDYESKTYFADTEFQVCLTEYNPEDVNDVKRHLDTVMVEDSFQQLKEECVKSIMKSLISQEDDGQNERHISDEDIKMPEFIYNF